MMGAVSKCQLGMQMLAEPRRTEESVLNGFGKAGLTTHASPLEVSFLQGKVNSCVFSDQC